MSIIQNDWKLLQNYFKKINFATIEIEEKEKKMEEELNSYIDLYYKYKRKIRILNDDNLSLLGFLPKDNIKKKIKITSSELSLNFHSQIKNYLFDIRNNNNLLFKFIETIDNENNSDYDKNIIAKIFVHFYFEDITKSECSYKLSQFISYLINNEISKNNVDFNENFFEENSFIHKIFNEYLNRHEIKLYTKHIFEDLIKGLIKSRSEIKYISLYLQDIESQLETLNKKSFEVIDIVKKQSSDSPIKQNKLSSSTSSMREFFQQKRKTTINTKIMKTFYYSKEIPKVNNIDESELLQCEDILENKLRKIFKKEKDEIKKGYINKQLLRLSHYNKKVSYFLYSYQDFIMQFQDSHNYLKVLPIYMENFREIKKFFTNFINNLRVYYLNLPTIIKETMNNIYKCIHSKYKSKTKFEISCYVLNYFINYVIIPIFKYPERNEILSKKLELNKQVHKNLNSIILIFEMISRSDLFDKLLYKEYTPLNSFIMDITIDLHKILLNYILNTEKEGIFEEDNINKQIDYYQTICLSKNEMEIFLDKFKELELENNENYSDIISNKNIIFQDEKDTEFDTYYVFLNKNFNESRKSKLKINKVKELIQEKSQTEYVEEIKNCMRHVLCNSPELSQKANSLSFKDLVVILNNKINYLHEEYKNVLISNSIPLSWYSDYIQIHMNDLPKDYQIDDFNKLFNEMKNEAENQLEILSDKNILLMSDISSEIDLLKKYVFLTKNHLNFIKKYRLKLYSKIFINTENIEVCLLNGNDKFNVIYSKKKMIEKEDIENIKAKELILSNQKECIHFSINNNESNDNKPINGHCSSINQFINRILHYKKDICCDIENEKEINETKANEIIELYMEYIEQILVNEKGNKWHFNGKNKEKSEKKLSDFLKEIKIYILNKILSGLTIETIEKDDIYFNKKCKKYCNYVQLDKLNINPNQISKTQINMATTEIKKMDNEKYYINYLKYLLKAINIISKMIEFTTGDSSVSIEEFLPILVYIVINSIPLHMISNLKFGKYFINQNDLGSMFGYTLANYETCINYFNKITENINEKNNITSNNG